MVDSRMNSLHNHLASPQHRAAAPAPRAAALGSSSSSGSSSSGSGRPPRGYAAGAAAAGNGKQQSLQDPPSAYANLRQQLARQHGAVQLSLAPPSSSSSTTPKQQQQQRAWPRPADEVQRALSRRLKQAADAQAVLALVAEHGGRCNGIHTALAFAQLARHLRFEGRGGRAAALAAPAYSRLEALALRQAGRMSPRQVAMVLTSLTWMGCPAEDSTDASVVSGGGAAPAPAGQRPKQQQQSLLRALGARLQQQLDAAEPEDTCHCLWALAKLGALDPQLLAAASAHSLSAGWLQLLTAKPLASLLWVHAQAHLEQQQQDDKVVGLEPALPRLLGAVMHELRQPGFLATWTPQELCMLLWSCTVLGVPLEQHQQQQEHEQQDSTAGVLLPALPLSVLQEVCGLCLSHVGQFTPQGIAIVCWALSQLLSTAAADQQQQQQQPCWRVLPSAQQHQVVELVGAFSSAAAGQLGFYKPQEVSNLLAACARLRLPSRQLTAATSSYVAQHSQQLGARDVAELLLGYVQQHAVPGVSVARALAQQAGQLAPAMTPFQLAAGAWCCTKLGAAYGSQQQQQQQAQSECEAGAARLLAELLARLTAAAAGTEPPPDASSGQQLQRAWEDVFAGSNSPKLAVMVAWAASTAAWQRSNGVDSVLLPAALHQLQRVSATGSPSSAVQLLCVLVRVMAAAGSSGLPLQQLTCVAATHAVLTARLAAGGLLDLAPADAVTAAWAAVRLEQQLSGLGVIATGGSSSSISEGPPVQEAGVPQGSAASVLAAALQQLQEQQQLAGLPSQAVVALLWACRAARWAPPPAVAGDLLHAVHAHCRQLQLGSGELMAVALGLGHLHHAGMLAGGQQQQQQQQQLPRLAAQVADQLQQALEQDLDEADAAGSIACLLGPDKLVALAAACSQLPQLRAAPHLLLLVVELWQLQVEAGPVTVSQQLQMVAALADCRQQQQQQQQQQPAAWDAELPRLLQQALGAAVRQLNNKQLQEQQPANMGRVAAQVLCACTKLRHQLPPPVMALVCGQLQASLPLLTANQLVTSLHALAFLDASAAPSQQLAAGLLQQLRQCLQQQHGGWQQGLPWHLAVRCLWAATLLGARSPGLTSSRSTRRLLVMVAHVAAGAAGRQQQQLLEHPQLAAMVLQARQLMGLPPHRRLLRALRVLRVALPPADALTQVLAAFTSELLPAGLVGASRRQALARLLAAEPGQLPQLPAHAQRLLPLWQQQQLRQACLQRVAVRLAAALGKSGVAPAAVKLRHMPTGDMAMLLLPPCDPPPQPALGEQQQQQQQRRQRGRSSLPGSPRPKGIAVVLEGCDSVAANTGWPLGPSAARQAVLAAHGYAVQSLPLVDWMPAFLKQQPQQQQQQQPQQQSQQQQPGPHGSSRRGQLLVRRHKQLRRLVAAVRDLQPQGCADVTDLEQVM